ncbi:MAG: sigma 54-interacting transcriptional regulator [Deltaproteobacteria bacterium]|nr:sigma 54-interacting transcriptional regulator [Deltaproteobacteria bacterium]
MKDSPSTIDVHSSIRETDKHNPDADTVLGLCIAWSRAEPSRIGEVTLFEHEDVPQIIGRGEAMGGGRAAFYQQRPGRNARTPPLADPVISREQLRVVSSRGSLVIEQVGRCPLLFDGQRVERATLAPGACVSLKGQLLLLCVRRPLVLPALRDFPAESMGDFGEPDAFGLLGESPEAWALRDAVAFQGKAGAHVLILGPSGAGKELVARATHLLSTRARRPFVARNAATIPASLVDAELFGTARNYPNAGMPERPGLIGAADGGTLFLDEIGEMPLGLHANLLRVLDGDGEYHRLGEAKSRTADVRLLAATNRAPESLKHDLLARIPLRQHVPGLCARREDIPMLARHLLQRALAKSPELVKRFTDARGEVQTSSALIEHLLQRTYTTHVRELDGLLWRAMTTSAGSQIELPSDMDQEQRETQEPRATVERGDSGRFRRDDAAPTSALPVPEYTSEQLRAKLVEHNGNLVQTARALGLASRYVLYRLLRKHAIDVRAARDEDASG